MTPCPDPVPEEPAAHDDDEAAPGTPQTAAGICPRCGGTGRIESSACPGCDGEGTVTVIVGDA